MYYMARCQACMFELPFKDEEARDVWANEHSGTPHITSLAPNPDAVMTTGAIVSTWTEQ